MSDENENQESEKKYIICCDPNRWMYKYIIVCFVCLFRFGYDFCFNQPSAVQVQIQKSLNITNAQYTLIQTFYLIPKLFSSIIGGIALDKYLGLKIGTIVLEVILFFGQVVVTLGAFIENRWIIYGGRFIFGCGAGAILTAQNGFLVCWFQGRTLSFIFGLKLSLGRVSSIISMVGNPILKNYFSKIVEDNLLLAAVFAVGILCVFISFLASIFLAFLHYRAEVIYGKILQEKAKQLNFYDILNFGFMYWIITFIIIFFYSAIFPFNSLSLKFFIREFGLTETFASYVSSMIFSVPAVLSPITGLIVDKTGRNVYWVTGGLSCLTFGHIYLAFVRRYPAIGMFLIGFSLSIVASSLWPLITYCVPKTQIATAYGVIFSVQSVGMAITNFLAGKLVDEFSYFSSQLLFSFLSAISVLWAILLIFVNLYKEGLLNATPGERSIYKKEEELKGEESKKALEEDKKEDENEEKKE